MREVAAEAASRRPVLFTTGPLVPASAQPRRCDQPLRLDRKDGAIDSRQRILSSVCDQYSGWPTPPDRSHHEHVDLGAERSQNVFDCVALNVNRVTRTPEGAPL